MIPMLHLNSMEGQKTRYDPRFYFIAINSLTLFKQPSEDISLLFRLGTKTSESKYSVGGVVACEEGFQLGEEEAQREVHILKYGAEEFLNIFVKAGDSLNSYSRILLPPLQELPHARHTVTAKLIDNIFHAAEDTSEDAAASGQLSLDIYFQFNFSGSLEVIPVSAHLERNIAQIGEMKPKVRLELEEQSWCSLEAEGGIHPHWSGHFHANRNSNRGLIDTIEENLKSNKLDQWARLLKMASNSLGITSKKQERIRESAAPYFDCTDFTMQSAGSYMTVEIISDPFIGSKPDVIGTARIRVEDEGLLKYPRKPHEKIFEQKLVSLFHMDEVAGEEVSVGVLKLYVRFVFDKERVVKKNRTFSLL